MPSKELLGIYACSSGRTVQKSRRAYAMTRGSMKTEIMAWIKAFIWLESQDYTPVCMLTEAENMIRWDRYADSGWSPCGGEIFGL